MQPNSFRTGRSRSFKSDGFILLLIVLAFLGIGATILFAGLGAGAARTEQKMARATAAGGALNDAKQMLIAYLISPPDTAGRPSSTIRPGTLPTPDSLGNGNYDGNEDDNCLGNTTNGLPSVGSTSTIRRCLGKFPWKTIPIEVGDVEAHDPIGRVPWLAVSSNLIFNDSCLKVLNSDVATLASPVTPSCPGGSPPYLQPTTLPHPWLSVYDQDGILLSNKVAAVLILPGSPIATETRAQARSAASLGNPADYLDSVNLPLGCTSGCTLYDNAGLNNRFIAIPSGTNYPDNAQNTALRGQPLRFNDILVYLTIDEVMHYAEKRVASEMAKALKAFTTSTTTSFTKYPWLQPLSASYVDSTSLYSLQNTTFGAFPFMVDDPDASYRTDFDWALTGFSETLSTECVRIDNGPSRFVRNTLTNSIAAPLSPRNIASGTVPIANGVCQWRGANRVMCNLPAGQTVTTTFQQSMTIYSNNTCTNAVGPATLSISRDITSLSLDVGCVSPARGYLAASAGDVHRWTSSCASIITGSPPAGFTTSTISLAATDTLSNVGGTNYSSLPRTFTVTLATPLAGNKQVVTSRMRYHPIMSTWFFHNRWYTTAFASWAPGPAKLPATPSPNPCSPATSLKVGGTTVDTGVVILAGPALTGQTRPAATISSYLEDANVTAGADCKFSNSEIATSSTLNDNISILTP